MYKIEKRSVIYRDRKVKKAEREILRGSVGQRRERSKQHRKRKNVVEEAGGERKNGVILERIQSN